MNLCHLIELFAFFVLPAHLDDPDHLQQSAVATCPLTNRPAGPDNSGHLQPIGLAKHPLCKRPVDPDDSGH